MEVTIIRLGRPSVPAHSRDQRTEADHYSFIIFLLPKTGQSSESDEVTRVFQAIPLIRHSTRQTAVHFRPRPLSRSETEKVW